MEETVSTRWAGLPIGFYPVEYEVMGQARKDGSDQAQINVPELRMVACDRLL
jgi:hypothetical protein